MKPEANNEQLYDQLLPIQLAKLKLFTLGVRISDEVIKLLPNICKGDYPSTNGLQIKISSSGEKSQWVTVTENINSSYEIIIFKGKLVVQVENKLYDCQIYEAKKFKHTNNKGESMDVGWLHMDRLRLSPIDGCADVCQFCNVSVARIFNESNKKWEICRNKYILKEESILLSSIKEAKEWAGDRLTHCLISGGTPTETDYNKWDEMVINISNESPVDIDLMVGARKNSSFLKNIARKGKIKKIRINLEIYDDNTVDGREAGKLIPTKRNLGLETRLHNLEVARKQFPDIEVGSLLMVFANKDMPLKVVLKGVEALAKRGITPVLSPFKPSEDILLYDRKTPSLNELVYVYLEAKKICTRYGIKLGPAHGPDAHNTITFNE